ncbi:MAG: NAD-dependent deacylase [Balneolaceae bacterium]|nr:NAD-dependent deacylase [Balneolaceae bacterium]
MPNKKLVVLSGAGVSAESGLKTFRDSGGLWEGHDVLDVASIEGWNRNQELVLDFYNQRRKQLEHVQPNSAHFDIVDLEAHFDVTVITQNVDNLHERAGSTKVIHLHGELTKACSSIDTNAIIDIGYNNINLGDKHPDGSPLRPAVVWFGEMVPMIELATEIIAKADILIVVGTSLVVYPAAGLVHYADKASAKYIIDPGLSDHYVDSSWMHIKKPATLGMKELKTQILN